MTIRGLGIVLITIIIIQAVIVFVISDKCKTSGSHYWTQNSFSQKITRSVKII